MAQKRRGKQEETKQQRQERGFNEVLLLISEQGLSFRKSIKLVQGFTKEEFYKMLEEDEGKQERYARACEERADSIFDEILEISDTPVEGVTTKIDKDGNLTLEKGDMLQHRRLQVDARKWALVKMQPKKYGDKVDLDLTTGGDKIKIELNLGSDAEDADE